MHYYKFNIADWHLATSHLSLEEEIVYFRLINFYYDTELPIPTETQSVLRRLRLKGNTLIFKDVLQEFFVLEHDGWHHKRCDDEILKYHSKAEVNRQVGKLGGRPKKINNIENPEITTMVSENNPQITLTTNQEPLTKNQEPITNIKTIAPKKVATPEGVSDLIFKDYLEVRKAKKAKWTETALKGLIREAEKAKMSLEQAMQMCCERNWVGFKAEWAQDSIKTQEKAPKWNETPKSIEDKGRELGIPPIRGETIGQYENRLKNYI